MRRIHLGSLAPESAAAVVTLVRTIYGHPLPALETLACLSWFDIAVDAQHRLPPEISEDARRNFMTSAFGQTNSDEVVKILQKLDRHNNPANAGIVEQLRKHHEAKLLGNKNYRADVLLFDVDILWEHIDSLLKKRRKAELMAERRCDTACSRCGDRPILSE